MDTDLHILIGLLQTGPLKSTSKQAVWDKITAHASAYIDYCAEGPLWIKSPYARFLKRRPRDSTLTVAYYVVASMRTLMQSNEGQLYFSEI